MSAKIHYQDDLYFLHSLIRQLDSGLRLELDAEFFWDKILEDVFFVDATLLRLFARLKDNDYLIHRVEYLRNLRRTGTAFLDFLVRIQEDNRPFSRHINSYQEKINQTRRSHLEMRRGIDAILHELEPDEETSDIVSSREFDFLLAADREDPDE